MLALGERYDAGRLSQSQDEVEKATIGTAYAGGVAQRRNAAVTANAAAEQAAAARSAAWPASKPTTCNRFGNSVTCY
jgi:hypothetical protein